MPDITMCTTRNCPFESTCYRKTATPNLPHQYYQAFPFSTLLDGGKYCEYYLNSMGIPQQKVDPELIKVSDAYAKEIKKHQT